MKYLHRFALLFCLCFNLGWFILDAPPAQANPLSILCPEGSEVGVETADDPYDAETSVWLLCYDANGNETKDITAHVVLGGVAILLVVIFGFIGLMMWLGFKKIPKSTRNQVAQVLTQLDDLSPGTVIDLRSGGNKKVIDLSGAAAQDKSLKHKLAELQEAYDSGLISQSDFEKKKQALLDNL